MLTREQAIERINKLLTLARNPSANPHEKANAENQAQKLMGDYHLTEGDLKSSSKVAAFDEIVKSIKDYAVKHPQIDDIGSMFGSQKLMNDVLEQAQRDLTPQNKVVLFDKLTSALRLAHFLFGSSNQTINDIRAIIETTLKSHDLPI